MKNILCFDTATTACTVSLLTNDGQVSRHQEIANIHSTSLLRMIDEVLVEANITLSDIDLLGVGVGPGSFTGLRIGIGVAQGLAYAHQIDIVSVSTLELIALGARDEVQQGQEVVVGLDARMGEIYTALFKYSDQGRFTLISAEEVVTPKFLSHKISDSEKSDGKIYIGNAWNAYKNEFEKQGVDFADKEMLESDFPRAENFAQYLKANFAQFKLVDWSELSAQYVRNNVAKKAGEK